MNYYYQYRNKLLCKTLSMPELAEVISNRSLEKRTQTARENINLCRMMGGSGRPEGIDKLPVVCFSREGKELTGLVLLSFEFGDDKNLVNKMAAKVHQMPQTVMTFEGLSGRTLKVVTACHWPETKEKVDDASRLDTAFVNAANFYSQALGQEPRGRMAGSEMSCRISHDPQVWVNPQFTPIPIFADTSTEEVHPMADKEPLPTVMSGYSDVEQQVTKFNMLLNRLAFEPEKDEMTWLNTLAEECRKAGIEEEVAVSSVLSMELFRDKELLVRGCFRKEYDKHPLGMNSVVDSKLVSQYMLDEFMRRRYSFRRNRVNGGVEYRTKNRYIQSWRPLDSCALNTITRRAISEGVNVWDKDVKRFVNSYDVPDYDPIRDYLYDLPKWDGKDRLKEMAQRVETDDSHWEENFKIWMRSMVSQWMGRNMMYGSSMVLMLTGAQGTGKSTFIRLLLPPQLMPYYLDRLDFTTKKEAEGALTKFALINLDEFDQISKSQTAYLKHLLQKSSVTHRKMYEDVYTQSQRYAAFAATTNSPQPLVDVTGSRRYMVEEVKDRINVSVTGANAINYPQLYAQVVAEIHAGLPAYFDAEHERDIQNRNLRFTQSDPLMEVFLNLFRKPHSGESSTQFSSVELLNRMHQSYKTVKVNHSNAIRLGSYLSSHGFRRINSHGKITYQVTDNQKETTEEQ